MRSHFTPVSVGKKTMRSHFTSGAAIACAVTSALAMMPNTGAAQIAYDTATDSTYASGWSAGQNGGYGFGAWSFDSTSGGSGQEMSSSSSIGTAWTLFNYSSTSGISDVGRSITEAGGLQAGQTFEAIIQNPTAYHFYRGFDILFFNGTDNYASGVGSPIALRAQVFDYFGSDWKVTDGGGTTTSSLTQATTGTAGVRLDLALTSATTYLFTLTPLNGAGAYSLSGTLGTSVPINYVNFRLYGNASTGPDDVADNFGISSMQILPYVVPEPASMAFLGLGLVGLFFFRRRK